MRRAIELFDLLAVAPGRALEADVFSIAVKSYHEYEECLGNVTGMCRSLIRTGCLYDAGDRSDRLHRNTFPLPGGWLRLELHTPQSLRFAWSVFEGQTLIESGSSLRHRHRCRPGNHLGEMLGPDFRRAFTAPLASSVLSAAGLDLFLSPAARTLFACPQIDPKRAVPPAETPERCRAPARQLFPTAVRLLQECGTLTVSASVETLARWCESFEEGEGGALLAGNGEALGPESRAAIVRERLALGALRLPRLLGCLLTSSQRGGEGRGEGGGHGVALPQHEALLRHEAPPPSSLEDASSQEGAARAWLQPLERVGDLIAIQITHDCQLGNPPGKHWEELMAAPPPLRRAILHLAPSLLFELVRRRDARRVRACVAVEPALSGCFRCAPHRLRSAWVAASDAADASPVGRLASWDLLAAACAGRGLTHQMVSYMLRSRAFAACGRRRALSSPLEHGDEPQPAHASARLLEARLACVAAARAVHNRKTCTVLRDAWGVLIEARLRVAEGSVHVTLACGGH